MNSVPELDTIRALHAEGRTGDALAAAEALVAGFGPQVPPDRQAESNELLGELHAALDQRDDALRCLRAAREHRRAARRQPELLRAYARLGAAHLAWDQLDEAESAYRTAIQQARTWADPAELGVCLLGLGRTLRRTDRADRALLAYTEAVACLAGGAEAVHAEAVEELRTLRQVPGGAR